MMTSTVNVQEMVSKLSSDKVKIREEGIKVLNTWLEGEESISFPKYLSEKTALMQHDEIPHSKAWPFLVALLTPCLTSELLSSKRRLPSLNFAKTLRLAFQCAKDPNSSVLSSKPRDILFDLADEESNPRVRENLLFNVCQHPHRSSERRLLNLLSMIEKLLLMLRNPDYQVGVTLARQIGVLFQPWEAQNELLQDIGFNFGAKLVNFSREKVVTAKKVMADSPQPRLFLETAITLMQLALDCDKIELEAGFIMSAVAAMDPCQRELVRDALDNLPRELQYTSGRSKVACQPSTMLTKSHFVDNVLVYIALHCSKRAGRRKGSTLLESSVLRMAEILENEHDKLIKTNVVGSSSTVLRMAEISDDGRDKHINTKMVFRLVKTPIRVCSFGRPRPVVMKAKMVSHTSIFAIKCRDFIVLGADSRVTSSDYSNVTSDLHLKIKPLKGSIFLLVSGDSEFADEVAGKATNLLRNENENGRMVEIAAKHVSDAITEGGKKDEYVGYIVAGASYDDDLAIGKAALQFEIYDVFKPANESCRVVRGERFVAEGSGHKYLKRFANFKDDIPEKEAIRLVSNALRCATRHDPATGGYLRTLSISRIKRAMNEMNTLIPIVFKTPCDSDVPYKTVQGSFLV